MSEMKDRLIINGVKVLQDDELKLKYEYKDDPESMGSPLTFDCISYIKDALEHDNDIFSVHITTPYGTSIIPNVTAIEIGHSENMYFHLSKSDDEKHGKFVEFHWNENLNINMEFDDTNTGYDIGPGITAQSVIMITVSSVEMRPRVDGDKIKKIVRSKFSLGTFLNAILNGDEEAAESVLREYADMCPVKSDECLNSRFCDNCEYGLLS